MNTYEVVNLRGEMKTLHGTSGLDALLRVGLSPKEWAIIRVTLGGHKEERAVGSNPGGSLFNSRTRADLGAKNYTTTRPNFSIRKFTKKVKSF